MILTLSCVVCFALTITIDPGIIHPNVIDGMPALPTASHTNEGVVWHRGLDRPYHRAFRFGSPTTDTHR